MPICNKKSTRNKITKAFPASVDITMNFFRAKATEVHMDQSKSGCPIAGQSGSSNAQAPGYIRCTRSGRIVTISALWPVQSRQLVSQPAWVTAVKSDVTNAGLRNICIAAFKNF